jgi:hypothetical protein
MSFDFEHLGELVVESQTVLEYESGEWVDSIDERLEI